MEILARSTCEKFSTTVKATLNGVPTKVGPWFDYPQTAPQGTVVLKLTDLGLGIDTKVSEDPPRYPPPSPPSPMPPSPPSPMPPSPPSPMPPSPPSPVPPCKLLCPLAAGAASVPLFIGADSGQWPLGPAPSCLNGSLEVQCAPPVASKCHCESKVYSTPFVAQREIRTLPGRTRGMKMYCFNITVREPLEQNSPCGDSNVLSKVEFWADDNLRRSIAAIGLKPSGATTMRFLSPSWGPVGDDILKVSPIRWTKAQADGGRICLELSRGTDLNSFCVAGNNTCWLFLFNESGKCCPLYRTTLP
ncbi:hypothetical protein VOLCADRAFT_94999 [Volvox carteri f. nagariensis]|uniref:Pherophorin domain-containing protein n=1 Tax=Volvox carteri f. nagariensis TaxID=3068 RepID=D8U6C1_VOLCA|nr:uncharacterized protein VOLCADRAFT_94999 [Volvox carteri f. nagariensis]EFJ44689.1 hypothetical protein VOLCADRAFT_94999 [Volvox carteri f. nagariensis]|eukprot:XP_002954265.1 hypothetical protein VOLCADRAFT_94999 [Volvox carteri f. nagariensis]